MAGSSAQCLVPLLACQTWALRGSKICIFLRYTHIAQFFGVRRTRLNGIISPPYHEATLDTFGFPVGGRLAARQAVFWARLPKMGLFGPKSAVFGPKIHFLWASSKFFATIMTGHQKDNVFMFIIMPGKLLGGARTCFWPKIGLKIRFFNATPT